ncbi:MAG: hypothetical protein LC737_01115, partial [Chloroflexi bacterium]|nr:hypothetical protein [Chloroflexota bacterium]
QTSNPQAATTLDGNVLFQQYHTGDAAAIDWLVQNAPPDAVIAEAVGGEYSDAGRIAVRSSIPTVLGWHVHELQWGRSDEEPSRRERDVNAIYSSADARELQRILKSYAVTYVVVGEVERSKYGSAIPFTKLSSIVEKVFDQQGTTIYRVK